MQKVPIKVSELRSLYMECISEAQDWFDEGKEISRFIFPKHGRFDDFSNPIKRGRDRRQRIVNPMATDAFAILTSGLHGRLTGQNRHWCRLEFANSKVKSNSFLANWLYGAQNNLHKAWNLSNFYEVMPICYKECAGFGTASVHISDSDTRIFNFDPMTFGEFVFILGPDGAVDKFFRRIEMSIRQMSLQYGTGNLPEGMRDVIKLNTPAILQKYNVVQCIYAEKYYDKPFKSVHFLEGSAANGRPLAHNAVNNDPEKPLKTSGYYEFPVPVVRWDVVGSYPFGIGLGSDVLPFVKRLQEMEKSFLMATHKAVDPPYNIPTKMRSTLNLLPGGRNFSNDPNHKIEPILNGGFEYTGVSNAAERVENHIRKMCYNDVFLTGMRDPNASPLKARQVDAQEDEGVIRLGPMLGRFYKELLSPIVMRCMNSMLRRGMFDPIDPNLLKEVGGVNVILIGPLAQQQKLIEVRGIQNFFTFLGGVVPFDDTARDAVHTTRTIDEVADIMGVPSSILTNEDERKQLASNRMKAMQEKKQKEDAVLQSQMQNERSAVGATAAKDYAAAGVDISSVLGGGGPM